VRRRRANVIAGGTTERLRALARNALGAAVVLLAACVIGPEEDPGCQRDQDCDVGSCRSGACFADPGAPLPPADPGADAASGDDGDDDAGDADVDDAGDASDGGPDAPDDARTELVPMASGLRAA
jgi:hypothetical protein